MRVFDECLGRMRVVRRELNDPSAISFAFLLVFVAWVRLSDVQWNDRSQLFRSTPSIVERGSGCW